MIRITSALRTFAALFFSLALIVPSAAHAQSYQPACFYGPKLLPCPTSKPSSAPSPIPTVAPSPVPTVIPAGVVTADPAFPPVSGTAPSLITYDSGKACIAHALYTNDVLPGKVGEFATNGLDRTFWGGPQIRTVGEFAGTRPGFQTSWGRHQYDTYFADPSDGLGIDPFSVGPDTGAPGSPNALRIDAGVLPNNIARSLTVLANDQWQVTTATQDIAMPAEGSSIDIDVADPNSAQDGFSVGMGYVNGPHTWIGTLSSGGAVPQGNRTGGKNPWHITNVHVYAGPAGDVIHPADEGGLRSYHFPTYWSGTLDANVNQQYGYFVSRIRMPKFLPAISPAFWTLETGGVKKDASGNLIRNELDIAEMFGATSGDALNTNEIAWNQPWKAGVGVTNMSFDPSADYHDYGVLQTPGNTSFYIDGKPIPGNVNLPDWTQGSPDKEIMLMIQVGGAGGWLDPGSQGRTDPWPVSMYSQWIRAYRPTAAGC